MNNEQQEIKILSNEQEYEEVGIDLHKYGICETEESQEQFALINKDEKQLRPGQIDNSDLEGEFPGELKLNILNNHDYVLVPEEAWFSLIQWYGCVSPKWVYKRKVFRDQQRNISVLDMYPPVLNGYVTNQRGEIQLSNPATLMLSGRKTVEQCFMKFKKRLKLGNPGNYRVYSKRIGGSWKEVVNFATTLLENQIETGSFLVFVLKKHDSLFLANEVCHNQSVYSFRLQLGDTYDVLHPKLNEWKLCHICHIGPEQVKFHIRKESSDQDFYLHKY